MADNNLANSSVTAEEIKEMAAAAREMAAAFRDANNEINKTTHNLSTVGTKSKSTSKTLKQASGGSGGLFGTIKDVKGAAGIGTLITVLRASVREMKNQTAELRRLNNALKNTTASGTKFVGKSLSAQASADAAHEAVTALKSSNNSLKFITDTFKKLYAKFIDFTGTTSEYATIIRDSLRVATGQSASQKGLGSGLTNRIDKTATALAITTMRSLYPDRSDTNLISDEQYKELYSSIVAAIQNGGDVAGTGLSTSGWQAFAAQNYGYVPGVTYTDSYEAEARRRYLADIALNSGGDEAAADRIKYYTDQTKLLQGIANSLYSFDEVEQINAVNMQDLGESVTDISDQTEENTDRDIEARDRNFIGLHDEFTDLNHHVDDATVAAATAGAEVASATTGAAQEVVNAINNKQLAVNVQPAPVYVTNGAGATAGATSGATAGQSYNVGGATAGATVGARVSHAGNASAAGNTSTASSTSNTATAGNGATLEARRKQTADLLDLLEQATTLAMQADESSIFGRLGRTFGLTDSSKYTSVLDAVKKARTNLNTYSEAQLLSLAQSAYGTADTMIDAAKSYKLSDNGVKLAGAIAASLAASSVALGVGATSGTTAGTGAKIIDFATAAGRLGTAAGFATGGIGTSPVTNATLFENGPEAVIPLTSDLGKTFMADAITKAFGSEGQTMSQDQITINIDGPTFLQDERAMNKLATEIGDRYAQVKARRGGI